MERNYGVPDEWVLPISISEAQRMTQLETMSWEKDGKVARVVFNRPQLLNAMSNKSTIDINTIADALAKEDGVRVVVLTGTGRSFSTGIDLKQLSTDQIEMVYHQRWERALRIFETMEKIVIVGIKQYCLGGGLQLALACDVRVAADNAILGLPAIKESLIPGLGIFRLAHYVGFGRAKQLILSGENVNAQNAYAMGLVDYVAPLVEFETRLEQIVRQYLKVCSIATVKSKTLTNLSFELGYDAFLKKYFELQEIAQTSEDHFEARRAYREKRNPIFK
jgi:enoyl-CoA hydratase/carnithine racemase